MAEPLRFGIIGCGNISAAYMRLAPLFNSIDCVACADLDPAAAQARAEEFNLRADTVEGLLAADDIDIIVNLTIPAAHFGVSKAAVQAGKHVYSEKPFVLSLAEGEALLQLAAQHGVRVGSAPDTFLGGAHQQARQLIDSGAIGKVTSGTAHVMGNGMESWHPNPDFFFQPGAGPILDIGPYYITNLVQLIGPVARVMAMSATPHSQRTIGNGPREGETVPVETPTTIHALLAFENGAIITLGTSWDVQQHGHANMELYGEQGTLHVPDPNFFGGTLRLGEDTMPPFDHPFGIPNEGDGTTANYRTAGLADMAAAIQTGRPHRCSHALALHVVDVMTSILKAGETGAAVALSTTCERPEALSAAAASALMSGA